MKRLRRFGRLLTSKRLEVLQLFAEAAEQYTDRQSFRLREGYVPVIKHDISKRQWREANKDLQRIYSLRHSRRKAGKDVPSIQRVKVEIFWDGDGWYYAKPNDSERLGGPFEKLHESWKSADKKHLEVMTVSTTRGQRSYRS